jgi:two-component system invasion response regulator UvrY
MSMEKIKILIADDHTLVRETWSFILSSDPRFDVIGECGTGEEAIELAKNLRPDVVIMDINLPGMNGIEATPLIRKFSPGSKVLAVSLHTQPAYARQIIQKGAMGYVTKNSPREEMFRAIVEVKNGRKYICDQIKINLSDQVINGMDTPNPINTLTERELEIIGLVKKGNSSKEIAEILHIAVKTVEVHRYNILRKLNLKNSSALVNFINVNQLELTS